MDKDTFLNRKTTLNLKGELFDLTRPCVMGILNVTPDSFYQGSRNTTVENAIQMAQTMLDEGAKMLDIGGYSSRPGAKEISTQEEADRILPVIEAISQRSPGVYLSVDTFRGQVARQAIEAGAHIINDISGYALDEQMLEVVLALNVPYILMHMKGTPQTMQQSPAYQNVTLEVIEYYVEKIAELKRGGLKDLILDPGFGFAKNLQHNYQLLQEMEDLDLFGLPLLVGFSRKTMIRKVLQVETQDALNGTSVLNTIALMKGAKILRVHDVKEAVQCIQLVEQMQQAASILN